MKFLLSKVMLYLGVLLVGFILGRQIPILALQLPQGYESTVKKRDQSITEPTLEVSAVRTTSNLSSIIGEEPRAAESSVPEEITAERLIEELANRKQQDFSSSYLYQEVRTLFTNNPQLAIDLLEQLLDIHDPELRNRLSKVLQNYTIRPNPTDHKTLRPATDWIMQQIKNDVRTDEWLTVISDWGAKTKESADHLLGSLAFSNSEDRTKTLLKALQRANNAGFPQISKFSVEEHATYAQNLEVYFDHHKPEIRAAAIATLNAFSNENLQDHLIRGINDTDEGVRIRAIEVIYSRDLRQPDIKRELFSIMQNTKRSAHERVLSYQHLQRMLLQESEYEAFYDFANLELQKLEKQSRQQAEQLRQERGTVHFEF